MLCLLLLTCEIEIAALECVMKMTSPLSCEPSMHQGIFKSFASLKRAVHAWMHFDMFLNCCVTDLPNRLDPLCLHLRNLNSVRRTSKGGVDSHSPHLSLKVRVQIRDPLDCKSMSATQNKHE